MDRDELFKLITKIDDPVKDYNKILANLHYTHFHLMDKYKKILESYDLTVTQSNVLGIIVQYYPKALCLEDIKALVLEPNSDVSRTIVRLATKGFIKKVVDEKNRRKLCIVATSKGLKASKKMQSDPRFKKLANWSTLPESKAFIKFLTKLRG